MENKQNFDIQYRLFLVDERPFCVWDTKFDSKVIEFLNSIEPDYYEYVANGNIRGAVSKQKKLSKFSSLILRTTYSQALETLFALISASIQAPNCPQAWFTTYKNNDLDSVVRKIHKREKLTTQKPKGDLGNHIRRLVYLSCFK